MVYVRKYNFIEQRRVPQLNTQAKSRNRVESEEKSFLTYQDVIILSSV